MREEQMAIADPMPGAGAQRQQAAAHQWGSVILLLILLLIGCAVWIAMLRPDTADKTNLHAPFIAVAVVLTGFCAWSGYLVNGRIDGILIDDRNRLSLSRLQWVAWFIVLLGGYYTEAVWNMAGKGPFPDMQRDLWVLLGIVSGSAVASNLIVDQKKAGTQPVGQAPPASPPQPGQPDQIGRIDRNVTVEEASWADLFLGEEVANRDVVDISRLQQLVITVLLVVSYVTFLWDVLGTAAGTMNMPPVADTGDKHLANGTQHGFLWLLGISHAAYLAYKATPKSGPGAAPTTGVGPGQSAAPAAIAPPAPLTAVSVRVAIGNAADVQALQMTVDGRTVAVPASGFVELSLDTGVAHRLEATGTRKADNQPVRGQLMVTPTVDDLDRAYELTLG
jgi:hypothetical protein